MTLGFFTGKRPFHTMTTRDILVCLTVAQAADPFRGQRYLDAFEKQARFLGYTMKAAAPCQCPPQPNGPVIHWPQCGLVKPIPSAHVGG